MFAFPKKIHTNNKVVKRISCNKQNYGFRYWGKWIEVDRLCKPHDAILVISPMMVQRYQGYNGNTFKTKVVLLYYLRNLSPKASKISLGADENIGGVNVAKKNRMNW